MTPKITSSLRCLVLYFVFLGCGCAQFMVAHQPSPLERDDVLLAGVERSRVVSRFGAPIVMEERGEVLHETYHYTDGGQSNSFSGKTLRILFYTAGDFFTLFVSQVVWMPAELLFDGTELAAFVNYVRSPEDGSWIILDAQEAKRR